MEKASQCLSPLFSTENMKGRVEGDVNQGRRFFVLLSPNPDQNQAMDRAHRLGQRKVVNVHRLIMRGTLEEKVMSLQKFKVSVANAIINAENASLKTMNTDQLLDLFTSESTARKGAALSGSSNGDRNQDAKSMAGGRGLKAILSGLEELWDQSQYANEYNLSHFLAKLNG